MQFVENISQWNELDKKNQMVYLTEIKIPTVKHKIRKKDSIKIFRYVIDKWLIIASAKQDRLK